MLKKVIVGIALVALAGTSAIAQSYSAGYGTGNIAPNTTPPPAAAPSTAGSGVIAAPQLMDRDNTSVPGQGVNKDDTTPQ